MQVESSSGAAHAFEQINRATQMLNQVNQNMVDQSQEFQNKMVNMAVREQIQGGSHIDVQA